MFDPSQPVPPMPFMQMQPLKPNNQVKDMGMKILQSALNQQKPTGAVQPQVGQPMAGGAMNITPPQQPMGILSRLLGGFGGGAAPAMDGGLAPPVGPNGGLGGLY